MYKILLLLFSIVFLSNKVNGQSWGDSTILAREDIFNMVEVAPKFPGGMKEFYSFISNNFKFPENLSKDAQNRIVIIRIVINKIGEIVYAEIANGINNEINQMALNQIKSMPKWTPGKQNNNPVNCYLKIPILIIN